MIILPFSYIQEGPYIRFRYTVTGTTSYSSINVSGLNADWNLASPYGTINPDNGPLSNGQSVSYTTNTYSGFTTQYQPLSNIYDWSDGINLNFQLNRTICRTDTIITRNRTFSRLYINDILKVTGGNINNNTYSCSSPTTDGSTILYPGALKVTDYVTLEWIDGWP